MLLRGGGGDIEEKWPIGVKLIIAEFVVRMVRMGVQGDCLTMRATSSSCDWGRDQLPARPDLSFPPRSPIGRLTNEINE